MTVITKTAEFLELGDTTYTWFSVSDVDTLSWDSCERCAFDVSPDCLALDEHFMCNNETGYYVKRDPIESLIEEIEELENHNDVNNIL
jgi:hypothetical protein